MSHDALSPATSVVSQFCVSCFWASMVLAVVVISPPFAETKGLSALWHCLSF